MRIETNQDGEAAMARLASRSPEELATFIVSLAHDSGPIGEHIHLFIVGDDVSCQAQKWPEYVAFLCSATRAALF